VSDGPINYGAAFSNIPSPFESFAKGMALGNMVQAPFLAQQQAEAQARQAQAVEQARQKILAPGATAEDRVNYLSMVSPEQSKAMQEALGQMDKSVVQNANKSALEVASAIDSGNIDVAKQLLETRAQGYLNNGTPQGKEQADYINNVLVKGLDTNPAFVKGHLLDLVAFSPDGKMAIDAYNSNKSLPHDIDLTDARAAEAWANAFKQKTNGLGDEANKIVNQATDNVTSATLLSTQALNLANAIDKAKPAGGWAGQAGEAWKKAVGGQDVITALRQEYVKLRNQDVIKNLPPGVASDKDIEIALAAFPPDTANPELVSSFLRGVSKLQSYKAETEKARAEWVAQNGNLGPARSDITIGEKPVAKGKSFWEFTKTIPIPNVAGLNGPGSSSTSGSVTVTSPSGQSFTFDSQEKADAAVARAKAAGLWK
jgi:hypothetical protein